MYSCFFCLTDGHFLELLQVRSHAACTAVYFIGCSDLSVLRQAASRDQGMNMNKSKCAPKDESPFWQNTTYHRDNETLY